MKTRLLRCAWTLRTGRSEIRFQALVIAVARWDRTGTDTTSRLEPPLRHASGARTWARCRNRIHGAKIRFAVAERSEISLKLPVASAET